MGDGEERKMWGTEGYTLTDWPACKWGKKQLQGGEKKKPNTKGKRHTQRVRMCGKKNGGKACRLIVTTLAGHHPPRLTTQVSLYRSCH